VTVAREFDRWADAGKDRGMEDRHWNTAKHALARMPVEAGEVVLDLGTGSGYALRALRAENGIGRGYGIDASPEMVHNARSYTKADEIAFLIGDFGSLPLGTDTVDHAWSMESFYYASDPAETLRELTRVLRPGGTFYCAVNYYEENAHSHGWADEIGVDMTLWSAADYRRAFRRAGFRVASQDNVPDSETEIPDASAFPTDGFATRDGMVERYRVLGTLLTVGVVP
jgi:ubiquinone/menaquinone biosynthesis C-methylase UbiE